MNMSVSGSAQGLKAAVAKRERNPVSEFRAFLERQRGQIEAALPKHIPAERMIRLACTEFSKNPALQRCSLPSVFGGIIQSAQLGLEIGVLGQAYLVPYQNRKAGVTEAQFIPGYKGLIALARRSGEVSSIETNIVYENDQFDLKLGLSTEVVHRPNLDGERGAPRLVYGVAKFKDGGHHFEWMSIAEVNRIRARSRAADSGPWVTDYEQMVRKTLIRRMANYLPMSIELGNAIQLSDAADEGKRATIEGGFVVVEGEELPKDDSGGASEDLPARTSAPGASEGGETLARRKDEAPREVEQAPAPSNPPPAAPRPTTSAAESSRAAENVDVAWTPSPEEQAAIRANEMAEAAAARDDRDPRAALSRARRERGTLSLE
jgi:recombination protein RecT